MTFCKHCGNEVGPNDFRCSKCGAQLKSTTPAVNDDGGFGWGLLGFCIPIVGLILFLVWRNERPNTAKSLITGAAIGFILGLIVNFSLLSGMY